MVNMLNIIIDDLKFLKTAYHEVLRSSFSLLTSYEGICIENYLRYGELCCTALSTMGLLKDKSPTTVLANLEDLETWGEIIDLYYKRCDVKNRLYKQSSVLHAELICLVKQLGEELQGLYEKHAEQTYTLPHRRVAQLRNGVEIGRQYKTPKSKPGSMLKI